MDGLLLVDKHAGCTSHDVVQQVRRLLAQRKIGHCGTLDPAATGLLVLTLGKATRLTRFLINAPKIYSGTVRFGITTDTYDGAGAVTAERPTAGLTRERVAETMRGMVGRRQQLAPPYSAKKHQGVKYYELARRGEEVPEALKDIVVYEFSPVGDFAEDRIAFELGCSSGTYVRSMAHELGEELGCGAHLESLRRLKVGPFEIGGAASVEELGRRRQAEEELGPAWVPFDEIPLPFSTATLDVQHERRIANGQTVLLRDVACEEGDWVRLLDRRSRVIAVGTVIETIGESRVGVVQPKIVFR